MSCQCLVKSLQIQLLVGPCKTKSESRIPPIWNLNPESKLFWKNESWKIALKFESQKVKKTLNPWKFGVLGSCRTYSNSLSCCFLKFESRIPGLFET